MWASIIQFINLQAIVATLSHVRHHLRPDFSCSCVAAFMRFTLVLAQVLLPSIDLCSGREIQLGTLQCASLTQHLLTCSLLLVPHLRAVCPLQRISEDSFSFWPLMNDVGRQLQRRGVILRHSDGNSIGVEQFCLKWFSTLFCCCFEQSDLRQASRQHIFSLTRLLPSHGGAHRFLFNTPFSVLVLDRLIAHCHTSPSLMRDAAQQRSLMSHALLAIAVELATFVSANPDPQLSVLESLHVLRIDKEQLLLLLGKAADRMPQV